MICDLYASNKLENIHLLVTPSHFKSNHMKKIELNIDIINRMLYEINKGVFYNVKWMKMLIKTFIFYWIDIIFGYKIMKLRKEIILFKINNLTLKD